MNKPKPTTHVSSIDALRGLAAVAVCLFHFSSGFLAKDNIVTIANQYGYLGVDAFYVISGFVIPLSFSVKNYQITQFWSYFKKRFVRIEPAYWVSMALIIFKEMTGIFIQDYRYFQFPNYTFAGIGGHFLHINDFFNLPWLQAVYWTLAIDWQFFLLIGVLFFWVNRSEWWARYPLYVAFIAVKWWFDPIATKPWLFYYLPLFVPGMVLFHYKRGYMNLLSFILYFLPNIKKEYLQRLEFSLIMGAVLYAIFYKMWWNHLIAATLSVLIIEFFTHDFKAMTYMGKISYSMYLTHIFSGWWVTSVLVHVLQDEISRTAAVFVGVVVSIAFAKLFYDYVEKPTQEWARKV
jgi:peptidoglycan/LPS O-acetylase OafA/YrhL